MFTLSVNYHWAIHTRKLEWDQVITLAPKLICFVLSASLDNNCLKMSCCGQRKQQQLSQEQTTTNVIQINQPTRCNSFSSLLLDVHMWLNMFWASIRPSGSAVGRKWLVRFWSWSGWITGQTTINNGRTRGS
jgi:hypothetical protein